MHLTAREKNKRLIAMAAVVALLQLECGVKPNIAQDLRGRIGGPLGG